MPTPGHPAYRTPDLSADEWRDAYFALAAVAQKQLDECSARPDVDTLTSWLIEDVTAERATRQGNPESRESFRFVALRLLERPKRCFSARHEPRG